MRRLAAGQRAHEQAGFLGAHGDHTDMIASQEARTSVDPVESASLDSARRGVWSPR